MLVMSEEGGCRHGIDTDILRISYFIFHILILKSLLVFFTFALTSFDNNVFFEVLEKNGNLSIS